MSRNLLLPPSLVELIDLTHPVRVVYQVVDNLNQNPIFVNHPLIRASGSYVQGEGSG